jgi:hypothetical protein
MPTRPQDLGQSKENDQFQTGASVFEIKGVHVTSTRLLLALIPLTTQKGSDFPQVSVFAKPFALITVPSTLAMRVKQSSGLSCFASFATCVCLGDGGSSGATEEDEESNDRANLALSATSEVIDVDAIDAPASSLG